MNVRLYGWCERGLGQHTDDGVGCASQVGAENNGIRERQQGVESSGAHVGA